MVFDRERAATLIRAHEGSRRFPYKDTVGKLTIGVGFNLDDEGLYLEEIEFILKNRIERYAIQLQVAFPDVHQQSCVRQLVLLDMAYNLGIPRLRGFKKMWKAIRLEDYDTAADEMLDSKWAKQVGSRAIRLAEMMRSSQWPDIF